MRHGIDGFFFEQAANGRRLSVLAPAVAALLAALLLLMRQSPIAEPTEETRHFGFEGTDEYVRRIRLESIGPVDQVGLEAVNIASRPATRGGGESRRQERTEGGRATAGERVGVGPGADDDDLLARARAMQLDAPLIRSEELVIDRLVRPVYPDEARDNDIEGVVEVLALVDSAGVVQQAQIIGGTGQTMLERAATDAVLQCRYHPYLVRGRAERVYAAFRIRFSLY